jgi:hypothetical protein|tara:strand:- start:589 stop:759 length:171 start_codon:yes stop_codon:yes gene_type:complete
MIEIKIRLAEDGMVGDATLFLTDEEVQQIEEKAGSLDSLDELIILNMVEKIRKEST